jgi:transcriptional regulator with XRE-family HTH domain
MTHPYSASFAVGSEIEIADLEALENFFQTWRFHNPLQKEQLAYAGKTARVAHVGFYHGGDPLYGLEGIPGVWHEGCLRMKPVNEIIEEARKRLGLTEDEVAERSGLSWNEYRDAEWHEDEARDVVHVRNLKLLVQALGLDLLELFDIECALCGSKAPADVAAGLSRSELVRQRREQLGLSQDQLGDRIGFETVAIVEMEKNADYLDGWSVDLVVELAGILSVPAQVLLGAACKRCGR